MTEQIKRLLPAGLRTWLRDRRRAWQQGPPVGRVRMGALRRTQPFNRNFGARRGLPICRYYIAQFLDAHRADIRGRVLEIGDDSYTRAYGGQAVTQADVLHAVAGNPRATFVGDLATGEGLPDAAFDCIILTQTLLVIYDLPAAAATLHRILKPGGVLLATTPGISQISRYDMDNWGDYWRLTTAAAERLFHAHFRPEQVQIVSRGNVLTAAAYLYGLASDDLRPQELAIHDPDYPLLVLIRAVKEGGPA